jgi:hypothetical protein
MDDAAHESPPLRRLFGWRILLPCLALSILAVAAAAFYLGWFAKEQSLQREPHATLVRANEEQLAHARADYAPPSGDLTLDLEGYVRKYEDHTHEVVVRDEPSLSADNAYHLGESLDRNDSTVRVHVSTANANEDTIMLWMSRHGAQSLRNSVHLQLFAREHRAVADVYETQPSGPWTSCGWEDVNGVVSISSWRWMEDEPVVIAIDLYGKCRNGWRCVHDKMVLWK